MEENPKISVIVPVHNGEKTIVQCLDSIYRTANRNFEVIVVNDCSTDNTALLLKKYRCLVINLENHSGVSAARNAGAKQAKGELLYFVDADVVQKTDVLSQALKRFEENPNINAANAVHHWRPMNKGFGPEFIALKYYYDYDVLKRKGIKQIKCSFFQALGGIIPRQLFYKLGGFDENIHFPGGEEFELGHKLNSLGYTIYTFLDLEVYHYWWSLKERILANYRRAQTWLPLFFKRRVFETKGGIITVKAAVNSILLTVITGFFFLSIFANRIYVPAVLLILYIIYNLDFYKYIYMTKRSFIYLLLSVFADIALSLSAVLGIAIGSVKYVLNVNDMRRKKGQFHEITG